MRRTTIKYFKNGKAVVHFLFAASVFMCFWVAGIILDIKNSNAAKRLVEEEEKSHVSQFITDNGKMLSTLSKCNTVEVSYSSMSGTVGTTRRTLQYHMLEKLIQNMRTGEGSRLELATDYWKSSGLKCEYRYTHNVELYKLISDDDDKKQQTM